MRSVFSGFVSLLRSHSVHVLLLLLLLLLLLAGGNTKFRALRLESGNFSWGSFCTCCCCLVKLGLFLGRC